MKPWYKRVKTFAVLFAVALTCCYSLCAQDAAVDPVAAPADDGWVMPSWLAFVLSFEFLWKSITVGIGLLVARLFMLAHAEKLTDAAQKEAFAALEAGVQKTADEFVNDAKAKLKDGKLTKAEIKEARERAYRSALENAKGPAYILLKTWGVDRVNALITKIVNKNKEPKK